MTYSYNESQAHEEKVLTLYLMLSHHQKVNFDSFSALYECSKSTFKRCLIAVRIAISSISDFNCEVIFNKKKNSYELIEICLNDDFFN